MPQCLKTRSVELPEISSPARRADVDGLIAQTMAILEQDHIVGSQVTCPQRLLLCKRMRPRCGQQESFSEEWNGTQSICLERWGRQNGVERAHLQILNKV